MADNTIIQMGSFVSNGGAQVIPLRSGVDWMEVINYTQWGAAAIGTGVKFEWYLGMPAGSAFQYQNTAATNVLDSVAQTTGGFTLINSQSYPYGPQNTTVTAISTANPPVVSLTSTAGLGAGQTVIFNNIVGAPQFNGIPFTIDTVTANTSFRLVFAPQLAVAGTTANFYPELFSVALYPYFQPAVQYISKITATSTTSTRIFFTTFNTFSIGQTVRINNADVNGAYGMPQIDGLSGIVTNSNNVSNPNGSWIDVNINATGFSAFAFPRAAAGAFTPATVTPYGYGQNAAIANPNFLFDAVLNTSFIGMLLGGGITGPAGQNADVVYWKAGKSFNT